jgi:hypothetical protein
MKLATNSLGNLHMDRNAFPPIDSAPLLIAVQMPDHGNAIDADCGLN